MIYLRKNFGVSQNLSMRFHLIVVIFIVASFPGTPTWLEAQQSAVDESFVPAVSFSGNLVEEGLPTVADEIATLNFRLYDRPEAERERARLVWGQQYQVPVDSEGQFHVALGGGGGVSLEDSGDPPVTSDIEEAFVVLGAKYLSISIVQSGGDREIGSWKSIQPVPYAFRSLHSTLTDGVVGRLAHQLGARVYTPWLSDGGTPAEVNPGPRFQIRDTTKSFDSSLFLIQASYRPIRDEAGRWWLDFDYNILVRTAGVEFDGGRISIIHQGHDQMPFLREQEQLFDGMIVTAEGEILRPTAMSRTVGSDEILRELRMDFGEHVVVKRIRLNGFIRLDRRPEWVVYNSLSF